MSSTSDFELVRLKNGTWSVRSKKVGEVFHPVVGPNAEAEQLYVHQLRIPERLEERSEPFVVWDVGLGAAANVLALFRTTCRHACPMRVISFDCTLAPLEFALAHRDDLGYIGSYSVWFEDLIRHRRVQFQNGSQPVEWEVRLRDFPGWLAGRIDAPPPDAILYDAYSPARNPDMWTLGLFQALYGALDPRKLCTLATYSLSTMLRVTLLLSGFYVGEGVGTGEKKETTVASNDIRWIPRPLTNAWLDRVRRSTSAEPLHEARYEQKPLSVESWQKLQNHAQFRVA